MFGYQSFYVSFFVFYAIYIIAIRSIVHNRINYCIWCFIPLLLLSALRGETVGGDLHNYLPEFYYVARTNSIIDGLRTGYHEPGYLLLIKLISLVSSDNRCYLVATSIISLIGPLVLIEKYSKNISVSVLLYFAMGFYTNTFNNVRQSMAISIIFCSIPFLINRCFWKYVIGTLLATSVHYSAFVMILIYPLFGRPLDIKRLVYYFTAVFSIVILFTSSIFRSAANFVIFKYDPESILENTEGKGYGLFTSYLIILLLMAFYYIYNKSKLSYEKQFFFSMIVLFQLFATAIQLTAPIFSSMVRMTNYFFIPIVIIAVPFIYNIFKSKDFAMLYYLGVFTLAIAYMGMVYSLIPEKGTNSQAVIPYVFINTTIF